MKVLLIAYKIKKETGSEDEIGYRLCSEIAKNVLNTTLVSREKNISPLRRDVLFSGVKLVAYDLPNFLKIIKKFKFGLIIYYYLWQIGAGRLIKSLDQVEKFDVIHQVNFGISWIPHFIRSSKAKVIWGPLMLHEPVPYGFWRSNRSFLSHELLQNMIKRIFWKFDPFLHLAVKRTNIILWSSPRLPDIFKKDLSKIHKILAAGTCKKEENKYADQKLFNVLYVGRFIDLKGCILAAQAFFDFVKSLSTDMQENTAMTMIGAGHCYNELRKISENILQNTKSKLNIIDWMPQSQLDRHYQTASAFLFPSHEGQGVVVAEALSHGCPVICLEDTGPSLIAADAAQTVKRHDYKHTLCALQDVLRKQADMFWYKQDYYCIVVSRSFQRARDISWEKHACQIVKAYGE